MLEFNLAPDNSILRVKMIGPADFDEIVTFIKCTYPRVTLGVIWDLSDGDMSVLMKSQLRTIIQIVADISKHKATAYIGPEDLQFGLLRMYEVWAEMSCVPPFMSVFRNGTEADEWMNKFYDKLGAAPDAASQRP